MLCAFASFGSHSSRPTFFVYCISLAFAFKTYHCNLISGQDALYCPKFW